MTISDLSARPSRVTAYADARAVLDQPLLVPEPAADVADAPVGSLSWLRATVARFTGDAQAHARRRAHAEAELARLDSYELRRTAAGSAVAADDRHTVVRILAEELGLPSPEAVADAVVTVSAGYFGGELTPVQAKAADEAVASLLAGIAEGEGTQDLEAAAQRIGLLVQACDATARLVEHARRAAPDGFAPGGADALLAQVLRQDPPVTALRRRALADVCVGALELRAGEAVLVDVTAAQQGAPAGGDRSDPDGPVHDDPAVLAFGAGPHRCPGRTQALALAAGLLERDDPAALVTDAVARALDLVATWTAWDGRPLAVEERVYTPHKVIRRIADHLVDHLAELEARLVGEEPEPDHWHASTTTTPADLAPFTTDDLEEARSRLVRLGRIWADRLGALTDTQLDRSPGQGWSFRLLAAHVAGSLDYYAGAVGRLGTGAQPKEQG
ncbi:hypothetical protein ACIPSA_47650 [Streptomyces sp. NPDC086549]|uniref:hypothetical protein n=1 Tax=Streptomyces sp. NPDC086549 TaxID=3365752 RepID=UPI003819081E